MLEVCVGGCNNDARIEASHIESGILDAKLHLSRVKQSGKTCGWGRMHVSGVIGSNEQVWERHVMHAAGAALLFNFFTELPAVVTSDESAQMHAQWVPSM